MWFETSLFQRWERFAARLKPMGSAKPTQTEPVGIYRHALMALYKLRREHHLIQVRIGSDPTIYQSMILEVNAKHRLIVMDELVPRVEGDALVGTLVSVMCLARGATTRFKTRLVAVGERKGTAFYCLDLPRDVVTDQRRSAYRLAIREGVPVGVAVRVREGGPLLTARPVDISSSGVRFELPGIYPQLEDLGEPLTDVLIRLGSEQVILCDVDVRSVRCSEDDVTTTVGGRFNGISNPQRNQVERFITRAQRLQRQRELSGVSNLF